MRREEDLEAMPEGGSSGDTQGQAGRRLAGRVALITGSSRGIGRAIARALAVEGASVAVHCVRGMDNASGLAGEIQHDGGTARVFQGDVSRPDECNRIVQMVSQEMGPVDILVNNAGITRDRTLRKMTSAEWDDVVCTNLNSVFHCTKAVLEPMVARGWGRIINVASIIGQTGAMGQSNYAAAKAGVIAFTKSAALELARYHITVNAICPGFVETDMIAAMPDNAKQAVQSRIPLGRFGNVDEIARLVKFLCTDGDWITGAQLNINGGQFM
jgi:NAD(P)-dependent dehydrogenase (short-subunit alcohol dehydrogenase family)